MPPTKCCLYENNCFDVSLLWAVWPDLAILIVLGDKFSFKISPIMWQILGCFIKHQSLTKKLISILFGKKIGKNRGIFYFNIWSHWTCGLLLMTTVKKVDASKHRNWLRWPMLQTIIGEITVKYSPYLPTESHLNQKE